MENELYREYKLKNHANYFVLPSYTLTKRVIMPMLTWRVMFFI